jgi:F-type H+-transporting ATPase subunit epsilon
MADSFSLTILLPDRVLLSERVTRLGADAENGSFVVRPRHIDFATALVPGLLYYQQLDEKHYIAINSGILVKQGEAVWVSVLQAIPSDDLEQLDQVIEDEFYQLSERDKQTQTALARLEVSFLRGMADLGRANYEF